MIVAMDACDAWQEKSCVENVEYEYIHCWIKDWNSQSPKSLCKFTKIIVLNWGPDFGHFEIGIGSQDQNICESALETKSEETPAIQKL